MTNIPRPQEIYRHFKGNLYQVITVAEHSETGERLVIYQALYGDFKIYARELGMFMSRVDRNKYPNATQEYRFALLRGDNDMLGQRPEKVEQGKAPFQTKKDAEIEKASADGKDDGKRKEPQTQHEGHAGAQEEQLDPMLIEFLDADTYEQKLNVLAGVHHRITHDMITTMAVASDIEVEDGELEDRYRQLKNCLLTLEKYECNRMG